MGYVCYQIIRLESKHHNDFSKYEKGIFNSFRHQEKLIFYFNNQGKEIAEVLLGRRSLECPLNFISEWTDWYELDLLYNIWVIGFGKSYSEEYDRGWTYVSGLYFYENGKFNEIEDPIYEFDRIRLYIDKQTFNKNIEEDEIVKLQNHIILTEESEVILDFVKKGKYSFGFAGFNLFDYSKISSLYQVYGEEGIIVNPYQLYFDFKPRTKNKLVRNDNYFDEIYSRLCDFPFNEIYSRLCDFSFKIEVFHNDKVVFLSFPQRELDSTKEDEIECRDFAILRWSNLVNEEWLQYKSKKNSTQD